MAEIEAKFLLEDESQFRRLLDRLRGGGFELRPLPAVEIVDRYLDTPDWRILKAGWAYRWRQAGGTRKVGLKSVEPHNGVVHKREEIEEAVDAFPEKGHRPAPGKVARKLGNLGGAKPRELFRIRNHRVLYLVRAPEGTSVELAFDHASITASPPPGKLAPGRLDFKEVELELMEGSEERLRSLAESLQAEVGLLPSRLSKFERGMHTAGLSVPSEMRPETRRVGKLQELQGGLGRRLKRRDPVVHYAWRYLLARFEALLIEEPRAWEGLDPEGVHRMRVATRRIRAALRAFRCALPSRQAKALDRELKWIARVLGRVRDLDVLQENFERYADELPAGEGGLFEDYRLHLADRWREARNALIGGLSSDRYERLKAEITALIRDLASEPESEAGSATVSISKAAVRSIGKDWRKVLREGRALTGKSSEHALHSLRINCKRLRYLIEVYLPVGGKPLKRLVESLKALQDVLGEHQDACVATEQLRDYANHVPVSDASREQLLGLGQMIESHRLVAAQRRSEFPRAWKRFDRKGLRKEVLSRLR